MVTSRDARTAAHAVLLGDSIFDNGAYTGRQPDVLAQLRRELPQGWRVSLLATDGASTGDIKRQLAEVPADATHLVISVGGNDALMNADILRTPVASSAEALLLLGERASHFEAAYGAAIDGALALGHNATVCTIYNGDLDPESAPLARVGLMIFNDAILRAAFARKLAVVDLRLVCTEPADFTNQIEPSGAGGRKIAAAVAQALTGGEGTAPCSRVYARP